MEVVLFVMYGNDLEEFCTDLEIVQLANHPCHKYCKV